MDIKDEIWIIDDHPLFSAGMMQLINGIASHCEIKTYSCPKEINILAQHNNVVLIIMDFYLPEINTLDWITQFSVQLPHVSIVIVTSSTNLIDKKRCLEAGASAYFPKHASPEQAIEHFSSYFLPGKQKRPSLSCTGQSRYGLTERQVEILIQLSRGHSNKKIAKILQVSPETIKSHISAIYRIINCSTRDDAVEWARVRGFM